MQDHILSVLYASFEDTLVILKELDPGALLAKTDVKAAFRLLPIDPG